MWGAQVASMLQPLRQRARRLWVISIGLTNFSASEPAETSVASDGSVCQLLA